MNFPLPQNETERLSALDELQISVSVPEEAFDDLTRLAAEICAVPIALITIIDEDQQWFKSRVGTDVWHTRRELAFCAHAICQTELFVVPDTLIDSRFAQHPMVTGEPRIRFYAGAPLMTREGCAVGTLCVLDREPRALTEQQQRTLRVLSRHVAALLELRRTESVRRAAEATLSSANAELERRVAQRTAQLQTVVKQAEAAKLHISNMVERMSDGMIALDRQWRFDYVNRKAGELLGCEPIDMLGKSLMEVFPTMVEHPFLAVSEQAAREQKPLKTDVYYEPRAVWFECRCYPSPEGISFFFQDISVRKRAEAALAEASSRLELAVKASNIGLWSWEIASEEVFYSTQFKAQLGYAEDEFPHLVNSWAERVHPEDYARVWAKVEQYLADPCDGEYEQEYRLRHKDGSYRWILSRARLYSVDGKPDRMVGCHIETTERRATEEALRALAEHLHSVREEEAGRIARELHDELGSALTALKMDASWVDRQVARLLDPVRGAAIHERFAGVNQLIDETIGNVRKVCQALRPAVLDQLGLAAAVDWQCADFQARTGVTCHVERDDAFALDEARATAIFRILQELLTNVARHSRATRVEVLARCDQNQFRLTVIDNGKGLPEDAFVGKNRFGLVGVRERALAAAGSASFESRPGRGTTVKVCIPAVCERHLASDAI